MPLERPPIHSQYTGRMPPPFHHLQVTRGSPRQKLKTLYIWVRHRLLTAEDKSFCQPAKAVTLDSVHMRDSAAAMIDDISISSLGYNINTSHIVITVIMINIVTCEPLCLHRQLECWQLK